MSMTDRINARIDPKLKASVEGILAEIGLSAGEAIRMYFKAIEAHRGIPFEIKIPNKETREAMEEGLHPERLKRYKSFAEIRKELDV